MTPSLHQRIVVVTEDETFWRAVSKHLTTQNYSLEWIRKACDSMGLLSQHRPALVMADRRLPDLGHVRHASHHLHVPFVSVQPPGMPECDEDCLYDLEQGAAMAICTQSYRELAARVRAILRREQFRTRDAQRFEVGTLRMDLDRHEVTFNGRSVELTLKEFKILQSLMELPGKVFTRQELLNRVWGEEYALEEHTLDVHIYSLRQKIEQDPARPRLLLTVRGVGYKLQEE